jgi:hypothetical protein
MPKTAFIFFALIFAIHATRAQAPAQSPTAEVTWLQAANASPMAVKFTLQGEAVGNPWPVGAELARGPKEVLKWDAVFEAGSPAAELKDSVELLAGGSGAALLVGDFAKLSADQATGKDYGYTKLADRSILRAALLKFPIGKKSAKAYPVYLVNGDPENVVKVSVVGGRSFELHYAKPEKFNAPVGDYVKLKLVAKGLDTETRLHLEPYQRGGIMAFYRPKDAAKTLRLFVNLYSIESRQERFNFTAEEE